EMAAMTHARFIATRALLIAGSLSLGRAAVAPAQCLLERLSKDNPSAYDEFGLGLSVRGSTFAISVPADYMAPSNSGSVRIFARVRDCWATLRHSQIRTSGNWCNVWTIWAPPPTQIENAFGPAVAIGDETLLVGDPGDSHAAIGGGA